MRADEVGADEADTDFDDDAAADPDLDPDGVADDLAAPATATRAREGLPPSYRMRAEPHYVEALVGRALTPVESPLGVAVPMTPAAADPPAPIALAAAASSAGALAATAASLAEAFDAIQASLRDLPLQGRPLRDRVAIELARAEATRGRWLADAAVVLQTEPLPALDELDLIRLLAVVYDAFGPENRLSGGAAAMPVPSGRCLVFGDERLLTTALGAVLAGVRLAIEDRGDARKMRVSLGPRREAATRTLEVAQHAVRLPASAFPRFFDTSWTDHPAGPTGALLLAAARTIAVAHGGNLEIGPLDGGGCRLVLSLPAAD